MKPQRTHYGKPKPTRAALRVSLMQVLSLRDNLDTIAIDSLARSYAMTAADVQRMIDDEKARRSGRGLLV